LAAPLLLRQRALKVREREYFGTTFIFILFCRRDVKILDKKSARRGGRRREKIPGK
jgi:hypothetical protein